MSVDCVRRLAALSSLLAVIFLLLAAQARMPATEVQAHGLAFEHWVADTFFDGYRPDNYTGKWDIPASVNRDREGGGIPVNPKAARHGSPVGLGDALRQWDIDEPFLLVVGYWEQATPAEKRFTRFVAVRVEPAAWRALWGPVTRADLERLEALVKDRTLAPREASRRARAMKATLPFRDAVFVLNPKIDASGQRRLQVSLRMADLFRHLALGEDPAPQLEPRLWGVAFPGPLASPPRERGQ